MKWQFALGLLLCVALAVYASPAEQVDDDNLDEASNDALADMAEPELAESDSDLAPEEKLFFRRRRRRHYFVYHSRRRYYRRRYHRRHHVHIVAYHG
ncbi:hypothetical protein BOX15_Mlig025063g1 [Macrostomum lignano]|uniref:Uncharacterized protein n=1 Tax=Macrostomum lignano TaxID=282301 RepID=A0A267FPJ7_9PLAT|nr:hypothetical protein BOX15_Mlig025063g1 [Macrostomum lignano]